MFQALLKAGKYGIKLYYKPKIIPIRVEQKKELLPTEVVPTYWSLF